MRLIDADRLIEDIEEMAKTDMMKMLVERWIKKQPTAFDVDKVVSELDILRKEYEIEANIMNAPPNYTCYYKGRMRGYEHSIDIVKRGGLYE